MKPEKHKAIEHAVIGLVACAVSIDVLAAELPRVMPYLVMLVVLFVLVRLVLFYTRRW
jgi:hypothetical protein